MKAFQVDFSRRDTEALAVQELPAPAPARGEVLVRMRAASLNYRDLLVTRGLYPAQTGAQRVVPLSDGAGEVVEIGEGVTRFRSGDRVVSSFFQGWIDGAYRPAHMATALGGAMDGVLAQYVKFSEQGLAKLPDRLSFEQGATLPCAALTAWHALVEKGRLLPGETVLVLGTGGVSIFALQFARMAGARVIAISSSEAKLARAKALGADGLINYRTHPDWEKEVLALTGGAGVDHVVEVGGAGTLPRSLEAVCAAGRVSLIGVLTGLQDKINPRPILVKSLTVQGIYVGSRAMLERMIAAVETNRIEPVIDRVFPFDAAPDAYRHLASAQHVGKVVIRF